MSEYRKIYEDKSRDLAAQVQAARRQAEEARMQAQVRRNEDLPEELKRRQLWAQARELEAAKLNLSEWVKNVVVPDAVNPLVDHLNEAIGSRKWASRYMEEVEEYDVFTDNRYVGGAWEFKRSTG